MGKHPRQYIHNVASSVMGQVGLAHIAGSTEMDHFESDTPDYPHELWSLYGLKVMGVLGKMGPSALGRIAACGVAPDSPGGNCSHWEMNQGKGLSGKYDAKTILIGLAAQVVAAAMVDIIRAQVRAIREGEFGYYDSSFDVVYDAEMLEKSERSCLSA